MSGDVLPHFGAERHIADEGSAVTRGTPTSIGKGISAMRLHPAQVTRRCV